MNENYAPGRLIATAIPGFDAALLGGISCRYCGRVIAAADFRVTAVEDLDDTTRIEIEVICSGCHKTSCLLNLSVEPPLHLLLDDDEEE